MPRQQPHGSNLRKGRHSQPGLYYFLTTNAAERKPIFTLPECAIIVINAIHWLDKSGRLAVDAAVVMPDHVHLAASLQSRTLAAVMHTLKSFTANRLAACGVDSPVWQPGYHDHALRDDEDYAARIRYLVENPVRAGLVQRVEDYPFLILPSWWRV